MHYQLIKIAYGALDSATLVSTSSALPVDLRTDNLAGNLDVNIAASGITLTVSGTVTANAGTGTLTTAPTATLVDDAAFSPGATPVLMVGATFDDTTPDSVNEGDGGAVRMSGNRNLYVQLRDAAGNERGVNIDASNRLSVAVDSIVALAAGSNNIGDVDVASLPTLPAGDNNIGNVDVLTLPALPAGTNNIGDVDVLTLPALPAGTNNIGDVDIVSFAAGAITEVQGDVAHDAAAAGNPVLLGAYASAAAPTDVSADGDAVRLWALRNGAQAVQVTAAGALVGGDATNGLDVDVTRVQGTVTITGTVTANAGTGTLAVSNTVLSVVGGGTEATAQRVTLANDSTGVLSVDDNGGSLTVDGTVTANAGTGTFTTQDTSTVVDDAAFTPGTSRVTMFGAQLDNTTPDSVDEGDGGALRMSANRNLFINLRDAAGNERGANVNASNQLSVSVDNTATVTVSSLPNEGQQTMANSISVAIASDQGNVPVSQATASALNAQVVGDVAHDGADGGNPVKIGGVARTTNPTAVAGGDRVNIFCDDLGKQVMYPIAPRDRLVAAARVSLTSTTETSLIAAGGAGVFRDLVMLILSNESATECRVDVRDVTAGTVMFSVDLAGDGGGAVVPFRVPWPQATANSAWTVQCSAGVSTVYASALFVENN